MRPILRCSTAAALIHAAVSLMPAQTFSPPPTSYTVVQTNSMMGSPVDMTIQRDGSKAVIEFAGTSHSRTLYDLQSHRSFSFGAGDASANCGSGTFSGDWGDPFASAVSSMADLTKQGVKETGAETVNGIATKVMEGSVPGQGKMKVWVDTKFGIMVKAEMGGKTVIEVKQMNLSKPPASTFVLPDSCAAAASAPTEAERIAALTGGNAADFTNATMPPASPASCTVLVRIVRAGSLETIVDGFQIAVDKTVDVNHPASYTTGMGTNGHSTFSGGGLREETAQLHAGVLRMDNAPAQFHVEVNFGNGGDASALIYRQCFGPQTTLLFVAKNPARLSDGVDWLWVKAGKFAGR